jgi:hypothetical protein
MILDGQNLFSDAQAITSSAASTNLIDLKSTTTYAGTGKPLYVVSLVDTAMTDASSNSTVTVTIQSDSTSAFGSAATVLSLTAFAATAAAGTVVKGVIPPDTNCERYIRAYYTVANGALTTGAFTTFITTDLETYRTYADGFTIS